MASSKVLSLSLEWKLCPFSPNEVINTDVAGERSSNLNNLGLPNRHMRWFSSNSSAEEDIQVASSEIGPQIYALKFHDATINLNNSGDFV
jgi:hypothetical protein